MTLLKVSNHPTTRTWQGLVNNFVNDFDNHYGHHFGASRFGFSTPVNIVETDSAYHLELVAPGRNKEKFSLQVENNLLTISYDKNEEKEKADVKNIYHEFSYRAFKRNFMLDDKVNANGIEARYEDGLLKVLLPKKAEIKPDVKQVVIQ